MLDKQSIKILKFIDKQDFVSDKLLKSKFNNININSYLNFLIKNQYVSGVPIPYYTKNFFTQETKENFYTAGPYKLTPKGKVSIKSFHIEYKKTAINTIITVLITAILSNIDRIIQFVISIANQ